MKATVVFLLREGKILLARKMKKIGAGKRNGYGGRSEPTDQSIRHTACRELFEESGEGVVVMPENLICESLVDFYFFDNYTDEPNWSVMFYLAEKFNSEAKSTDEMSDPQWFDIGAIPYEEMLPADKTILEKLLAGTPFTGYVRFNEKMTALVEAKFTNKI